MFYIDNITDAFKMVAKMVAYGDKLEFDTGSRDLDNFGTIPTLEQAMWSMFNETDDFGEQVELFNEYYPNPTYLENFLDKVDYDFNIPLDSNGLPRFLVSDIYGDSYEGINWEDEMSNEELGYTLSPFEVIVVPTSYDGCDSCEIDGQISVDDLDK